MRADGRRCAPRPGAPLPRNRATDATARR
jgi:hypothetical protein